MQPSYGEVIAYDDALALNRANPYSRWPRRGATGNRLEPEAWPGYTRAFRLEPGQRIFTMGSCFARNIEEYLKQLGFDVPTLRMSALPEARGRRANAILNKYTPTAIVQEIEWARGILDRDGVVGWPDIEPLLLEVSPGRYLDLHLDTTDPVGRERVLSRRQELLSIYKDGFECDLMIITPGVIEAWYDTASGAFVQRMPMPDQARSCGPGRFKFKVLTYEECHASLARAIRLMDPAGTKRFLLTVSPVPLARTFTDQDVIVANQYSKSVLRAAVGRICSERKNCDYFPSYESVMLTRQAGVWEDDLIHVTDGFVSRIVGRLVEGAAGKDGTAPSIDSIGRFVECVERNDRESALAIYREIGEQAAAVEVPSFHDRAMDLFLDEGDPSRALLHARRHAELRGGHWKPLYQVAVLQYRLGDHELARATAAEALALARSRPNARLHAAVERMVARLPRAAARPDRKRQARS